MSSKFGLSSSKQFEVHYIWVQPTLAVENTIFMKIGNSIAIIPGYRLVFVNCVIFL